MTKLHRIFVGTLRPQNFCGNFKAKTKMGDEGNLKKKLFFLILVPPYYFSRVKVHSKLLLCAASKRDAFDTVKDIRYWETDFNSNWGVLLPMMRSLHFLNGDVWVGGNLNAIKLHNVYSHGDKIWLNAFFFTSRRPIIFSWQGNTQLLT